MNLKILPSMSCTSFLTGVQAESGPLGSKDGALA
jgi:hypothetical protein